MKYRLLALTAILAVLAFAGRSQAAITFGDLSGINFGAPGPHDIQITATSDVIPQQVQGYQFQINFSDPSISFDNWVFNPAHAITIPGVNTTNPDLIGISAINLAPPLGVPIFSLDASPTLLGTLSFTVQNPLAQGTTISLDNSVEFRDPNNNQIEFNVVSPVVAVAIPEPSTWVLLLLVSTVFVVRVAKRGMGKASLINQKDLATA